MDLLIYLFIYVCLLRGTQHIVRCCTQQREDKTDELSQIAEGSGMEWSEATIESLVVINGSL